VTFEGLVEDALAAAEYARRVSGASEVVWVAVRFGALVAAGISGLIVPDLPLEEAGPVIAAGDERGLALVPLVAPTTPDARLELIGPRARGVVYAVSVMGTTGERAGVDGSLGALLARVRTHTQVPVAVGFGVSTPAQARAVAGAGAAGVIIGSRLVRAAAEAEDPAEAVGSLVAEFYEALRTT